MPIFNLTIFLFHQNFKPNLKFNAQTKKFPKNQFLFAGDKIPNQNLPGT